MWVVCGFFIKIVAVFAIFKPQKIMFFNMKKILRLNFQFSF